MSAKPIGFDPEEASRLIAGIGTMTKAQLKHGVTLTFSNGATMMLRGLTQAHLDAAVRRNAGRNL